MVYNFKFSYPLIGSYESNGLPKNTELGSLNVYGQYKLVENELTIKSLEYDLGSGTSLKNFTEWQKAGGDCEYIEKAAYFYCGQKHISKTENEAAA